MERKAARGEWTAGHTPYGYRGDPQTHHLAVVKEAAAIVRIIFDEYVHKNIVAKAIAVQLNQRGHRTQFGKPWNHKAVLTVLRNRTYLGEIYFRGRWHRGVERPFHSAIVDEDTFAGCSRRAARRWRTTT